MNGINLGDGLTLSILLFVIGLVGVLIRRNVLFILMSIEIMLNAVILAFIICGLRWKQADGQVMFIFVLTIAAAELAVGLALVFQFYDRFKTLDIDVASEMRG